MGLGPWKAFSLVCGPTKCTACLLRRRVDGKYKNIPLRLDLLPRRCYLCAFGPPNKSTRHLCIVYNDAESGDSVAPSRRHNNIHTKTLPLEYKTVEVDNSRTSGVCIFLNMPTVLSTLKDGREAPCDCSHDHKHKCHHESADTDEDEDPTEENKIFDAAQVTRVQERSQEKISEINKVQVSAV